MCAEHWVSYVRAVSMSEIKLRAWLMCWLKSYSLPVSDLGTWMSLTAALACDIGSYGRYGLGRTWFELVFELV